jgi:DNA-binding transcriptional ArsR family regulator
VPLGPLADPFGGTRVIPDFMAPIPDEPSPSVEAELELVRATDADVVRADIADCYGDDVPPPWDAFLARPREMLDRLADAMHAYWEAVLADDWPRLRSVLEGDVLGRARALATSGPEAVLAELHPRMRWRPPVIELDKPHEELAFEGRSLVLIPLVFAKNVLIANQSHGDVVALGYQARGTAELATPEAADGRLDLLLGAGRATVLRALEQPATTTELALRLSYAPSTVSAHLDVLSRAGLVDRHRVRRSVFYGLNETGRSLVALLGDVPAALSA